MLKTSVRKIPKQNKNGDCFQAAGKYIMDVSLFDQSSDCVLVHGIVTGQGMVKGIRFLHAWVEKGDLVIDKSNGRDLNVPKNLYYALGHINPQETVRYTWKEAAHKMATTRNYGPWDIEEPPIEGL